MTGRRRVPRRLLARGPVALLAVVAMLLLPSSILAHAELVTSSPADGAQLDTPPTEVVLTFSEAVTGNSSLLVQDASGATIATGVIDAADDTMMRAQLPALEPGAYAILWTSVADDGDVLRGTLHFTVASPTAPPATSSPTPPSSPAASTGASPGTTALPTPSSPVATPTPTDPTGGNGAGGGDVLLPIIAAAVIVVGGLAFLLRRRTT